MWSFVHWESTKGVFGHGTALKDFQTMTWCSVIKYKGKRHKELFGCSVVVNDVYVGSSGLQK
jgi:hypothetical protein